MGRLITSNHQNPCPICQKTNGNCRIDYQSELVMCMSYQDDDFRNLGYKYVKPSKDGLWGIYVPLKEEQDYSQERKEAYHKAKEAREKARLGGNIGFMSPGAAL